MKRSLWVSMAAVLTAMFMSFAGSAEGNPPPKYIFFFLGDGMASAQIQATEAYLTVLNGGDEQKAADLLKPGNRLNMSKMSFAGMQTTYDAGALMTDSASSATAFASGLKTKSGVIGMDETTTKSYKSIAQLAHEKGMKVGIITSVSLDHATPAAYYASVANRGYMNNIATQMANSGYEFFGGGGLVKPLPVAMPGDDTNNDIMSLLDDNGYTVINDRASMLSLKESPTDKVVCINPYLQDSSAMPYAIDRPASNLTLKEMTEVAIANLYENGRERRFRHGNRWNRYRPRPEQDKGFFIMVEGGKIDWACHANDAMATIGDMLDFDDAVGAALDFAKRHPKETLIVVTGDHETGGMTIGHATTKYKAYYKRLLGQINSFQFFDENIWAPHESAKEGGVCGAHLVNPVNLASDPTMIGHMLSAFGIDFNMLNDYQKEKLEDAYDMSMCESNNNSSSENTLLYGGYEAFVVTLTHILNEQASIGWTSYSHTGVPVPVFAEGAQAWRFAGFYDNTDIAKKLAQIIGRSLPALR